MVLVEADGNYLQPFAVDDMDIYSGRKPNTTQALTILNYHNTTSASKPPPSPPRSLSDGTTTPTANYSPKKS
ncbi:L-ascorbate oxidase [Camellia lanceoleosa]|uniref:L-ascorbate oxidase n=1 Tax=Camellia lanceoleosa TaxID=1840588 RepID=A0ACC0FPU1_9ERIC|nr:L-ascorbate oxidase [Camellia lanceoleosa]